MRYLVLILCLFAILTAGCAVLPAGTKAGYEKIYSGYSKAMIVAPKILEKMKQYVDEGKVDKEYYEKFAKFIDTMKRMDKPLLILGNIINLLDEKEVDIPIIGDSQATPEVDVIA